MNNVEPIIHEVEFVKMHGLGNDFVIIDKLLLDKIDICKFVPVITNQHLGLSCDQFIMYERLEGHNNYSMLIYNQNSSIANTCGNGLRCLAKLIYLRTGEKEINITVANRTNLCKVLSPNMLSINMGNAKFVASWMPTKEKVWNVISNYAISLKDALCVDLGNPHLVIFGQFTNQDMQVIGKTLQENTLFPDGINVNFAHVKDGKIYLAVWERGAGLTLACGSGACATFAAAIKLGSVSGVTEVVFNLGSLFMSIEDNEIIMNGPASLVARGKFYYAQ